MSIEALTLGFLIAGLIWWGIAEQCDGPHYPARKPRHAQPGDVLPCFHDWNRHGLCRSCGDESDALKAAKAAHPSNQRSW